MFNLEKNPFSVRGAYLAISKDSALNGGCIWLRSLIRPQWGVAGRKVSDRIARFIPCTPSGSACAFSIDFKPHLLTFNTVDGAIKIYFIDWEAIAVKAENAGLIIDYGCEDNIMTSIEARDNFFSAHMPLSFYNFSIKAKSKNLTFNHAYNRIYALGTKWNLEIKACHSLVENVKEEFPYTDSAGIEKEFEKFCGGFAGNGKTALYKTAQYILFSSVYAARGHLRRECLAASKNVMNLVWDWDNCFASLALAQADKKLCWDNILVFFELQKENGLLPDAANPFLVVDWYLKPPIQGFFIDKLLSMGIEPHKNDREFLINGMIKWTNFWLTHFKDKDGLLFYKHGNDSGLDNATCFDSGCPCVSPDLNAYIVLQMKAVARLFEISGKTEQSVFWQKKADERLRLMLEKLYKDNAFINKTPDGKEFKSTSIIRLLPIVLGKTLPKSVRDALINELKEENHFLTSRGYASESIKSLLYDQRESSSPKHTAYWRGPIWAPVMILIVSGLVDCGEIDFAKEVSKKFIMAMESADGASFYENYDALLNAVYDDSGFLWTAAAYILLKDGVLLNGA